MADGGRKPRPPILLQSWPGRSQHQQTTKESWGVYGPDYHNSNPWVRLLGRVNESEIKIDGKIGTALIDSCAMISMRIKKYCEKHGYEMQPWD